MKVEGAAPVFPLAMASENAIVRVIAIQGGGALVRRVGDMGLTVGSEVLVRQRQGAGLVVVRGGTRLAVGGGMAHKILVSEVWK
jgi:ferrous iron transport protein A